MGKLIFEFSIPFLLAIYFVVDILIPSFFTKVEYFWFYKKIFKNKPKGTFDEEVKEAERVYNDAKEKMEHLKDSATDEAKKAEKDLAKAKETLDNAKKKIENLNK